MPNSVVLFGLASFAAAVGSVVIFMGSKSAIHEILGVALGLVSAIFGVGCVVVAHLHAPPLQLAQAIANESDRRHQRAARAMSRAMDEAHAPPAPPGPDPGTSKTLVVVAIVLIVLLAGALLWWSRVSR